MKKDCRATIFSNVQSTGSRTHTPETTRTQRTKKLVLSLLHNENKAIVKTYKKMYASRGALVGLAVLSSSVVVNAAPSTCAFRFEGYLNISESPTWTLPAAEPFAQNSTVLNEGAPFVYKGG